MKNQKTVSREVSLELHLSIPQEIKETDIDSLTKWIQEKELDQLTIDRVEPFGEQKTFVVAHQSVPWEQEEKDDSDIYSMSRLQLRTLMEKKFKRKIVVAGASIGSDQLLFDMDRLLTYRGHHDDLGLESYQWMKVHNLRGQTSAEDLLTQLHKVKADVVIIARLNKEGGDHSSDYKKLVNLVCSDKESPKKLVLMCLGSGVDPKAAVSWGYDAGFDSQVRPSYVARSIAKFCIDKTTS